MNKRRIQAQEPLAIKNQKKEQNQKSPDDLNQQTGENRNQQIRQDKGNQRQNNFQKTSQMNNSTNPRQEKQQQKYDSKMRQNNFVHQQNQYVPTSPFNAPQNSFQQMAQQMQSVASSVLPQQPLSPFQMPNVSQQFQNTSQMLGCLNPSQFIGQVPQFQAQQSATLPQINIDSQQYFEMQKQIIFQQHLIQMQAQITQAAQQQQQKINSGNPFVPQQMINQQPVFDMGYAQGQYRENGLMYNQANFHNFGTDFYQVQNHNIKRNDLDQQSDQNNSDQDQQNAKNTVKRNLKENKMQNYQSASNNLIEKQKTSQKIIDRQSGKILAQRIEENSNTSDKDENNFEDENSLTNSNSNQTNLLGKRKFSSKKQEIQSKNLQKTQLQSKQFQPVQNKTQKIQSAKDMPENYNLAANQQIETNNQDQGGIRRSTRSIAKVVPQNQGTQQKKDISLQLSSQKKQASPRKSQAQPSQKKDKSFSPKIYSNEKNDKNKIKSTSPIQKYRNSSQSPNQDKQNSKNSSPTEKKNQNTKSVNSNTDTIVANEYAQILDQSKKTVLNSKVLAETLLKNQSQRTTRNQLRKVTGGNLQDSASNTFLELGYYGTKQTVRLQRNNDNIQYKKTIQDKKNQGGNKSQSKKGVSKDQNLQKTKNEFQDMNLSGKREAQTQIIQNIKPQKDERILRRRSVAHSVLDQDSLSNSEDYSNENEDDSQLMAELQNEKQGKIQQIEAKKEEPKVQNIQIFNDQQLKDMTLLFSLSQEQVEEIKKKQEEQVKSLQERSILFGEKVIPNVTNFVDSTKQNNGKLTSQIINSSSVQEGSVTQNSQIQNSITIKQEPINQINVNIQAFKQVSDQDLIKEEFENSEMSDENINQIQQEDLSQTQRFKNDVNLIEIDQKQYIQKNNESIEKSSQIKQNKDYQIVEESEEEALLFGRNQKSMHYPKNDATQTQQIYKQQDTKISTDQKAQSRQDYNEQQTRNILNQTQEYLKNIEQEKNDINKQIELLEEKIKNENERQHRQQQEKQQQSNEKQYIKKFEDEQIEEIEEYDEDVEMKIELSQQDEEMQRDNLSDSISSIEEFQENQNLQTQQLQNIQQKNQNIYEKQSNQVNSLKPVEIENQVVNQQKQKPQLLPTTRELSKKFQLPEALENLISFQKEIDQSLNLLSSRATPSSLTNLTSMIEKSCHRQFLLKHLRQIIFLAPRLYVHNWEIKNGKMELMIQATSFYEESSSPVIAQDPEQNKDKIITLPFKTAHIQNREIAFRLQAFLHILKDFERFKQDHLDDENIVLFNIFNEKQWPSQFNIENEDLVPQIPLFKLKDQPVRQQVSTVQDFINTHDSKQKYREIFSQIQKDQELKEQIEQTKKQSEIQINKKPQQNDSSSDENTSESDSDDDDREQNIQSQTGISQQTLEVIQMKQKLEEQAKQNTKELLKKQDAMAKSEYLIHISEQIWQIISNQTSSKMYYSQIINQIWSNKKGQQQSKETISEKIKLLALVCPQFMQIEQHSSGTMIKVHKNINLQLYNISRRVHEYFINENKKTQNNSQIQSISVNQNKSQTSPQDQENQRQPKNIQNQDLNNQDHQVSFQNKFQQNNQLSNNSQNHTHRSISSDRNNSQNAPKTPNNSNLDIIQNKQQQSQGSSAFQKFQRLPSQNQQNIEHLEDQIQIRQYSQNKNQVQEQQQNLRTDQLRFQKDDTEKGNDNNISTKYQHEKRSQQIQMQNQQNPLKNDQVQNQKQQGPSDNNTNGSSATFLTGEECPSNKSIDEEAQQRQFLQQLKINQKNPRDQIDNNQEFQKINEKNLNILNDQQVVNRELLEVTSQQVQPKSNYNSHVQMNNQAFINDKQNKHESPSNNPSNILKHYQQQQINLSNHNQKSNFTEIIPKVHQPQVKNVNIYQVGNINSSLQNQMYLNQKSNVQSRPMQQKTEGHQQLSTSQQQSQQNQVNPDGYVKKVNSYVGQAEFSENFEQRMRMQQRQQQYHLNSGRPNHN